MSVSIDKGSTYNTYTSSLHLTIFGVRLPHYTQNNYECVQLSHFLCVLGPQTTPPVSPCSSETSETIPMPPQAPSPQHSKLTITLPTQPQDDAKTSQEETDKVTQMDLANGIQVYRCSTVLVQNGMVVLGNGILCFCVLLLPPLHCSLNQKRRPRPARMMLIFEAVFFCCLS